MDLGAEGPRLRRHRRRPRPRPGHRRRAWSPRAPGSSSPGATEESLDAAVAELGDARGRGRRRQRRPGHPGPADRRGPGRVGAARRCADQRRRPAGRAGHRRSPTSSGPTAFESVFLGAVRLCREIGPALPARRVARARALVRACAAPLRRPGDLQRAAARAGDGRQDRSPTSSARAGSGSTGCCPAGSAPSGSPSSTPPPATPRRPEQRRSRTIPLRPLRRAGGVRPGRGLPALAGRVVRHRRHGAGRRRDAARGLTVVGAAAPRAARRPAPLVAGEVAEAEDRQQRRRTTTAGRRRSAGRCRARAARPAPSGCGRRRVLGLRRSTKPP